jgi:hypothetical protein
LLQGFHAIIALRRDEPHWMLNEADAKRYGAALANALRHFPLQTTQKAIDFSVLVFCIFEMETPRVVKSIQLAKLPPHLRRQAQRGPAKIFEFAPNFSPPPPSDAPQPGGSPTSGPVHQGAPPSAESSPADVGLGGEGGPLQ